MKNFLTETMEHLKQNGKAPADVRWVGAPDPSYLQAARVLDHTAPKPVPCGSWEDFARLADFEYRSSGIMQVYLHLIIVGDDWWLERHEHEGMEWWEFKTLPAKPENIAPLRDIDLKSH